MNVPWFYLVVDGTQRVLRPSIAPPYRSECGRDFHIFAGTAAPARDREVPLCPTCSRRIGYRAPRPAPTR